MKFKMKTILLIGSSLLLSASQLQATAPIVKFQCTEAMTDINSDIFYEVDIGNQTLTCEKKYQPRPVQVTAGNNALSGKVDMVRCSSSPSMPNLKDGKIYNINVSVTASRGTVKACTVSLQESAK
jgi:hypothetical protein